MNPQMLVYIFLHLCSFTIISTDHSAIYIPGDVRHTECTDMPYLDYMITRSHLTCSSWCSSRSDCIRYMFCNSNNTNDGRCYLFGTNQQCWSTNLGNSCKCRIKKVVRNATTGVCKCFPGFYGTCCEKIYQDCLHGLNVLLPVLGMIMVQPPSAPTPFEMLCVAAGDHAGTKISSRKHSSCSNLFNQTWQMYTHGFGTMQTGYWLGLERLHHVLNVPKRVQRLQITVVAASLSSCVNVHKGIHMSSEINNFTITLGNFAFVAGKPSCSDSIKTGSLASDGRPFSTYDHYSGAYDCPNKMQSGWWFADDAGCTETNINGPFQSTFPHASYDPDFSTLVGASMYLITGP